MLPYTITDPSGREGIADWAELFSTYTKGDLSKSGLGAYIEASSGSEADEAIIDSAWQELEFRQFLYGEKPPFQVVHNILKCIINWEEIPEYMACLIFALEGNPENSLASGVLFERITEQAIKNFLKCNSLRTGFPNKTPVEDIARTINEKFNYEYPSYRQDRDLDIVAWKDFGDNRSSQIVLLTQCAAGHNWSSKLKDLNIDAWRNYIHFACKPIKAFSIPIIISDKNILEEHSSDAGVILDRSRIYRNVINTIPPDNLRGELKTWCEQRLSEMLT